MGRGSLAGPLVASAVILNSRIVGLTDSKLLSRLQRQNLTEKIRKQALAIGIGWAKASEIDKLGLTLAVRLAMQRALNEITVEYHQIIIDGNYNFLNDNPLSECLVKADLSVPCVSAASIVAKVARDEYMINIADKYSNYGFETNVGYGTRYHLRMLQKHGICDIHRKSYQPISRLGLVV